MAEDAFGEGGTSYSRQEGSGVVCGGSDISHRLMAHMLGLEAPGVEPLPYYFFVGGETSQGQGVSYPPSTEFTGGMQTMSMSGGVAGPVGGNWSHNMAADNYGIINNTNYMYDFGEYGV